MGRGTTSSRASSSPLTILNARLTSESGRSAATLAGLACFALSLLGLFELAAMKQSALAADAAGGVRAASAWAIKATFAKSDVLAAYLVLGFPLLLCQLVNSRTRHGRDFWLVATTVSFTSILLTQDFLGLLALLAACAVFLAFASSRTVPLLICIFLIPVLIFGAWDNSATLSRTYEPIRDKLAKELRVLRAAPVHQILLGTGPKSLNPHPGQEIRPRRDQARVAADNAHLSLILEMGILGWLAMLAILAVALRGIQLGIRRARDPYERSLMCAIFASAVGFLISMSGVNVFFQISLAGLLLGADRARAWRRRPCRRQWRPPRQYLAVRGRAPAARSDADLAGARRWRIRAEHLEGVARLQVAAAQPGSGSSSALGKLDPESRVSYARRMRAGRSRLRHPRPPCLTRTG